MSWVGGLNMKHWESVPDKKPRSFCSMSCLMTSFLDVRRSPFPKKWNWGRSNFDPGNSFRVTHFALLWLEALPLKVGGCALARAHAIPSGHLFAARRLRSSLRRAGTDGV